MTASALIIGGTGFVGPHLATQLSDRYRVTTVGRAVDICNADNIRALVAQSKPEIVINLAAITTVKETFDDPRKTYEIGLLGLLNLLTVLKEFDFRGRFLQVSSSEVYGFPSADQLPLTEAAPLQPMSPYAVAKIAAEALCYQWNQVEPIDIVIARPFTHIGPGQSERFSVARFARQVAEIVIGRADPVVRVGNLTATRDLTDVRDVVRAYDAIIHKGQRGQIYNVCSGTEIAMQDVLDKLIALSGAEIKIIQDKDLIRNTEQQRICGTFAKLKAETGWQPKISLADTLSDLLKFELKRLSASDRPG